MPHTRGIVRNVGYYPDVRAAAFSHEDDSRVPHATTTTTARHPKPTIPRPKLTRAQIIALAAGPPDDHHIPFPTLFQRFRQWAYSALCVVGGILVVAVLVPLIPVVGLVYLLSMVVVYVVKMMRWAMNFVGGAIVEMVNSIRRACKGMARRKKVRHAEGDLAEVDVKVEMQVQKEGLERDILSTTTPTFQLPDPATSLSGSVCTSTSGTSSPDQEILTPTLEMSTPVLLSPVGSLHSRGQLLDFASPTSLTSLKPAASTTVGQPCRQLSRAARAPSLSLSQAMMPIDSIEGVNPVNARYAAPNALGPAIDISSPFSEFNQQMNAIRTKMGQRKVYHIFDVGIRDIGPFVPLKAGAVNATGRSCDHGDFRFGSRSSFSSHDNHSTVLQVSYVTDVSTCTLPSATPALSSTFSGVALDTFDHLHRIARPSTTHAWRDRPFSSFTTNFDQRLASPSSTMSNRHRILDPAAGIVLDYDERMARIHPDANRLSGAGRF